MKRRRKKLNIKKLLLFLLLLIFIPTSIALTSNYLTKEKTTSNNEPQKDNTPKEPTPEVYEASLIMVGDALVHNSLYNDANKLANYQGYDFKPMLTDIKEIVSNYDIAYYNQETILGGTSIGLSSYPSFNSPFFS